MVVDFTDQFSQVANTVQHFWAILPLTLDSGWEFDKFLVYCGSSHIIGQRQSAPGLRSVLTVPKGLGYSIHRSSQSFTRPQRSGPHSGFCTLLFPLMIFSFVSLWFFLLSSVQGFLTSVANIYHNVQIHDSLVENMIHDFPSLANCSAPSVPVIHFQDENTSGLLTGSM